MDKPAEHDYHHNLCLTEIKVVLRTYTSVWFCIVISCSILILCAISDLADILHPARLSFLPVILFQPVFNSMLSRSPDESLSYHLTDADIRVILLLKSLCSLILILIPTFSTCIFLHIVRHNVIQDMLRSIISLFTIALISLTRGSLSSRHSLRALFPLKSSITFFAIMRCLILPFLLVGPCGSILLNSHKTSLLTLSIAVGTCFIVFKKIA